MSYGFLLTFGESTLLLSLQVFMASLSLGFITMTPQLFINYKLKSVAHLPWRMLTYKALNTFIDDMFAFVIKMPTMYRIGCFRDGKCVSIPLCVDHMDVFGCPNVRPCGCLMYM